MFLLICYHSLVVPFPVLRIFIVGIMAYSVSSLGRQKPQGHNIRGKYGDGSSQKYPEVPKLNLAYSSFLGWARVPKACKPGGVVLRYGSGSWSQHVSAIGVLSAVPQTAKLLLSILRKVSFRRVQRNW
jgi:hypothetical protein